MTTRLQLVEVLEQIDNQTVDRPYVDFVVMAERLEECIEKVQELPHTPVTGD